MASILLAEDSATQLASIQALLEQDNNSVTGVPDGRSALDVIEHVKPELVVTDLRMPVMNGLQLVEAVVADYPTVPVIVVTSLGSEDLAVDALAIGATNFVPKRSMIKLLNFAVRRTVAMARFDRLCSQTTGSLDLCEFSITLPNKLSAIQPATQFVSQGLTHAARMNPATRMRIATATASALFNAVCFGNLNMKDDEDAIAQLVANTAVGIDNEDPFPDRKVLLKLSISLDDTRVSVSHNGPGMSTRLTPAPGTPESFELEQCRGMLLMTSFMDDVIFYHDYSEVVMVKASVA